MTVGSFLSFGFENLKRHFFKSLGLVILQAALVCACCGAVAWLCYSPAMGYAEIAIGSILMLFLIIAVTSCFLKNILSLCRGEKIDLMAFELDSIISFAITALICSAIISLCFAIILIGLILLFIPDITAALSGKIAEAIGSGLIIGGILLFIPSIMVSLMFFLAPFLAIDKGMGPIEAIKESIRLTSGHKKEMFNGLSASMIVLSIVSLFAVTAILVAPMNWFIYAYPYLKLTGQLGEGSSNPVS